MPYNKRSPSPARVINAGHYNGCLAGIITGEVLLGTFLLLFSGTIHRRYRWRQERSWVLFDWDVVADPPPAKQRRSAFHFGWGSKHVSAWLAAPASHPALGSPERVQLPATLIVDSLSLETHR